ncbi:hypothetical protein FHR24_001467 [Wenyingzhuangia heitensis]|uniref:Uncharacterized protein n=1 Tax=Wenyingzhuangia heitensis TaxID=1487859 RepID=A0ABX0U868_9FLAO|nr:MULTISPECIES: hypothetical protein [Wenyingzhuangia]NIJ45028.1 hypothetical protein [Wenyingzhuangia heitensis]NJB83650.1 hypothetical protein [Wenyingzhuangia aestuarii]
MSTEEQTSKEALNQNIDEVFGAKAKRYLKWHAGKKRIERGKIIIPKESTIKRFELLGISEILAFWKFNDLEIKRSGAGLKIEFTI